VLVGAAGRLLEERQAARARSPRARRRASARLDGHAPAPRPAASRTTAPWRQALGRRAQGRLVGGQRLLRVLQARLAHLAQRVPGARPLAGGPSGSRPMAASTPRPAVQPPVFSARRRARQARPSSGACASGRAA
jgi:hypothetical protein